MSPALAVFDSLPLVERLFVRGRLATAPFDAMLERVRGTRLADVGCGHGVLTSLLATGHPERVITGIDVDARKLAFAKVSVGKLANVRLEELTVEQLAAREPGAFDSVAVAHVLYLLPESARASFLAACRVLLAPGGRLVLLEAEADGSWRARKAQVQEWLAVNVLGRTRSSGGLAFGTREGTLRLLTGAGFRVAEVARLHQGYSTSHVLFVAEAG